MVGRYDEGKKLCRVDRYRAVRTSVEQNFTCLERENALNCI